jgi:hypothetical protein
VVAVGIKWKDILLSAFVFASVGPAVGFLGVIMLFSIADGQLPRDPLRELAAGLPMAYIAGAPSAFVAGLAFAALHHARPTQRFSWPMRVMAGAVLGAVGGGLLTGLLIGFGFAIGLVAGLTAGVVCGALVRFDRPPHDGRGAVTPNNSLERTRDR